MQISFGDDAFDAFAATVGTITRGYNVALLSDGEDVPESSDLVPYPEGPDVRFLGTTAHGVKFQRIDTDGETVGDEVEIRPWSAVAHVHIY